MTRGFKEIKFYKYFFKRGVDIWGRFFFRALRKGDKPFRGVRRFKKIFVLEYLKKLQNKYYYVPITFLDYRGRTHYNINIFGDGRNSEQSKARFFQRYADDTLLNPHYISRAYPNLFRTPLPPPSQVRKRRPTLKVFTFINKQNFKKFYFGRSENQFKTLIRRAREYKVSMNDGDRFLRDNNHLNAVIAPLESSLSTVLHRSGFYHSPHQVRSALFKGQVMVNGNIVFYGSRRLNPMDVITFTPNESQRIKSRLVTFLPYLDKYANLFHFPPFFILNQHLEISYSNPLIVYACHPDYTTLTFPFKASFHQLSSYYRL